MGVAMTTFGSNLSDLQRLTNEDKALDYQRANLEDQLSAQRLSNFLKARSEENKTKSQRDADAARMLDAQQARAQQGGQFDTQQRNLMAIESGRLAADKAADTARFSAAERLQGLAGANQLEIAKLQAANRPMDPRIFQEVAAIEAENRDSLADYNLKKGMSEARRALVRERNIEGGNKGAFDWGEPDHPKWKALGEKIAQMDAEAFKLGLRESPDGGYVIPPFTPIRVPAMLNASPVPSATVPAAVPTYKMDFSNSFVSPVAPAPAQTPAANRVFEVTPDGGFRFAP